jgi:hypothetical protein
MNILIYLAHPADFHLYKNVIYKLKLHTHSVFITIKKKDVLEQLLIENNVSYFNIQPKGRKSSKYGIIKGIIERSLKHYTFIKKYKIDTILASSGELGPLAKFFNIPFINVFEDDLTLFPMYSNLLGPFINSLVVPVSCNTGKWGYKTIKFSGYRELAYLHPNNFKPDYSKVAKYFDSKRKNFIIRFAKLDAWHDNKILGLTNSIFENIIKILEPYGNILITSEIELDPKYEKYSFNIPASDIHHVLYYADMYIGDSQTMTAEAAVLGTPAIRFNDFVGKLGYLEELEHRYMLTYGVRPSDPEKMYTIVNNLLKISDLKQEWQLRRKKMLSDKIDVSAFIVWFIENYPISKKIMKNNSAFQYNFR